MTHLRCAFAILLLFFPAAALADDKAAPPLAAAIIDVQRILQESLAAKSVQKQLEAHRAKFQAEISVKESELRKADQQLKDDRASLSPDALAEREQALRQKFAAVEQEVQGMRHALDEAFTTAMGTVRASLLETVRNAAKRRKVNIVLLKQQALWFEQNLDITDEVLGKIDKSLPSVAVKISPLPQEPQKLPSGK